MKQSHAPAENQARGGFPLSFPQGIYPAPVFLGPAGAPRSALAHSCPFYPWTLQQDPAVPLLHCLPTWHQQELLLKRPRQGGEIKLLNVSPAAAPASQHRPKPPSTSTAASHLSLNKTRGCCWAQTSGTLFRGQQQGPAPTPSPACLQNFKHP